MVETRNGISASTQMAVRALALVDSNNTNTTVKLFTDSTTVASKNEYFITAEAAGTYDFYIDPESKIAYKMLGYHVCVDEAVTLKSVLESYRGGQYRKNRAYDAPYKAGVLDSEEFDADDAQQDNAVYPLEQGIFKTPTRIRCTVSGPCNIFLQVMRG